MMKFYLLSALTLILGVILAAAWINVVVPGKAHYKTADFGSALFMIFQVLVTGGADTGIFHADQRIVFYGAIVVGLLVCSVLIGLITVRADCVESCVDW